MALPLSVAQGAEVHGSITLAVTTGGIDNDPTRPARITKGNWTAKPFASIQAALDALPKLSAQPFAYPIDVNVNVGPGTFAGFWLKGVKYDLNITGTRQAATPATGPGSGTATSGGAKTLVLTGAGWTADDLKGRFVNVTAGTGAGQILPILKNTTDTITFPGAPSPTLDSSSVFTIEDLATILSPDLLYGGACSISECTGWINVSDFRNTVGGGVFWSDSNGSNFSWQRCVVFGVTGNSGFIFRSSKSGGAYDCLVFDGDTGFAAQEMESVWLVNCGARNCSGVGISSYMGIGWLSSYSSTVEDCVVGLHADGTYSATVSDTAFEHCGTAIRVIRGKFNLSGITINNTTTRTTQFCLSEISNNGVLVGTGNAGFGLNLSGSRNVFELNSTPTITGASGAVTVDGTTDVTWASLASAGDYALDVATGARINRQ